MIYTYIIYNYIYTQGDKTTLLSIFGQAQLPQL